MGTPKAEPHSPTRGDYHYENGDYLRNFGSVSTMENIATFAEITESTGFNDLRLGDHIAIPPEELEGPYWLSEGRIVSQY